MTRVLFVQKEIPNYRIGIFNRLASNPRMSLTVSCWKEHFPEKHLSNNEKTDFHIAVFDPPRFRLGKRLYWFNFGLVGYILRKRPDVVIGPVAMFGFNSVVSKIAEDILRLICGTGFAYRTSFGLLPGVDPLAKTGFLRRGWYRWLYRNVMVSAYTKKAAAILKSQGCREAHIRIDYNSMDTNALFKLRRDLSKTLPEWKAGFLEKYGIAEDGYLLFVGSILPAKRLDVLIDAWKQVAAQNDRGQLVIVGSGPAKQDAVLRSRNVAGRTVFVKGIYDPKELARFYYLAGMVVFPGYATLSTHFSMCFGKAVITSPYGNEAEYISDGTNGLVCEYGNPDDPATKVVCLQKNPDLRKRYGNESEKIVKEKINADHMVETLTEVIRLASPRRQNTKASA